MGEGGRGKLLPGEWARRLEIEPPTPPLKGEKGGGGRKQTRSFGISPDPRTDEGEERRRRSEGEGGGGILHH